MATSSNQYIAYLDTNALRGKDFLETGIKEALESGPKHKIVKIEFVLPEVVRDEWVYHYAAKAQIQLDKLKTAGQVFKAMGIDGHKIDAPSKADLPRMGREYLQKLGFRWASTPYAKIDLEQIIKRAVNRQAPFNGGEKVGDKGIKDAVIALTIHDHASQQDKQNQIVVIGRDNGLLDYLRELFPDDAPPMIFSTIVQFQNHVELQANKLSEKLAVEAAKLFYTDGIQDSVLKSEHLYETLADYYLRHFPDAQKGAEYVDRLQSNNTLSAYAFPSYSFQLSSDASTPVFGNSSFSVGETSFLKRNGRKLRWLTRLTYLQDYTATDQSVNATIPRPGSVTHSVIFDVEWEATFDKSLNLTAPKVLSIEPISESRQTNILSSLASAYVGGSSLSVSPSLVRPVTFASDTISGLPSPVKLTNRIPDISSGIVQPLEKLKETYDSLQGLSPSFTKLMGLSEPFQHFWEEDDEDQDGITLTKH